MATIVNDLIDGQITDGSDGISITRVAMVASITGDAPERLFNAIRCEGIPRRGDPHPSIPDVIVASVSASPVGVGQFRVTVNYAAVSSNLQPANDKAPAQLTIGSTVQSKATNMSVDGKVMRLDFKLTDLDTNGVPYEREESYLGTVDVQVPQTTFRYSRRETKAPVDKAKNYVGKVNASLFQGDQAGVWLCTRIEGTSSDGGKTYNVEYEFQRNEEGWDATIIAIDPKDDAPPDMANVVDGPTIRVGGEECVGARYLMYLEADFAGLNLE